MQAANLIQKIAPTDQTPIETRIPTKSFEFAGESLHRHASAELVEEIKQHRDVN